MGKRENVKIIMDGFKADPPLSDDAMLQQLFEGGVPFGELRTVFNDIVKEKGLRLTAKERKAKTAEIMEGTDKIETADEVLAIVAKLQDKLKVTSTKAMGSLRTWAKGAGIELPKAPRVSKPRKAGFGGNYKQILDHILAEREAGNDFDKKSVVAFCHKAGIPEAYSTTALNVVHFAKVWSGEIQPETEEEEAA
ncbi:MAG: hypothetical protein KJN70_13975 [Eudoraea sp.]|nr:hypothetical protein [Eudoraea sp.]